MADQQPEPASNQAQTTKVEQKDDKKKKKDLDATTVQAKIYSPFKVYFSGPAISVSAENDTGPFDVLPKHHHFMTLLNPGDVTVRTQDGNHKFRIARGIMHVKDNAIVIFLDV